MREAEGGLGEARGRFAPSPSGDLHLGNLRTALAAWAWSRSRGAEFLLRIDDLDPDRSRQHYVESQLRDLRALGITWDGQPLRQSERGERYNEIIGMLGDDDRTYRCFCTRAEIRAAATAPHGQELLEPELAYPGTCAAMSRVQSDRRADAGEPWALRVRTDGEQWTYSDLIMGDISVQLDDFVIQRKDGVAAYNLATVVDDADSGIGLVVRGADLASSTPRQLWVYEALGLPAPAHAHIPLVVGADGERLAKRHGATTLGELAALGMSEDEVRTMLARSLGAPADSSLASGDWFDSHRIPRHPWTFSGPSS